MSVHLHRLIAAIDALTLRERASVAAATLFVIWGAWTLFVWDGIEAERSLAAQRIEAARSELAAIGRRSLAAAASASSDPDARSREERDRLHRQVARLDAELAERASQLITPEEMVGALRQLLSEQQGLALDRLELQAPVSALETGEDESLPAAHPGTGDEAPDLYKHAVELEWRGGFFETVRYLRAVERLGWSLYWESLEYEVIAHPEARVRLRLFTLSEHEGWIGV